MKKLTANKGRESFHKRLYKLARLGLRWDKGWLFWWAHDQETYTE